MRPLKNKLIIGSRGSELALWQAKEVARKVNVPTEVKIIRTAGDKFVSKPLQGQTEKGFFTKEIEQYLLERKIDLAVHSLKDLPTEIDPGLTIAAHLPRGPVSDLLLVRAECADQNAIFPVKPGCMVGATSLRRQAMLKFYGPAAEVAMLRGNVPTRVKRCKEGRYGAIILAKAGVERLKLDLKPLLAYELNPEIWLPAPGQGVIAVEACADDLATLELLSALDDKAARDAAYLERKLLANFEGGCHTAFAAFAKPDNSGWKVTLGIEQKDSVWAELSVKGAYQMLTGYGPDTLKGFQPRAVKAQEELCRALR